MNYYAVFLPMKDEEKSKEHRPEHLEFLQKMKDEGKVYLYGRFSDGAGGLVIYKANDLNEAISYVKEDPYVKVGARSYEIHQWEIIKD